MFNYKYLNGLCPSFFWRCKRRFRVSGKRLREWPVMWIRIRSDPLSETKKVAYLKDLGTYSKEKKILNFKRWFELKWLILLSWIRIRIDQVLWIGSAFDQCGSTSLVWMIWWWLTMFCFYMVLPDLDQMATIVASCYKQNIPYNGQSKISSPFLYIKSL